MEARKNKRRRGSGSLSYLISYFGFVLLNANPDTPIDFRCGVHVEGFK